MDDKLTKAEQITVNTSVIKTIESQIEALTSYANHILDIGILRLEVILEEIPNNGNVPVVKPIFDPRTMPGAYPVAYFQPGEDAPTNIPQARQIGYAKFYPDFDNAEDIDHIGINVQARVGLGVIDYMIVSLKNQRAVLVTENNSLIK